MMCNPFAAMLQQARYAFIDASHPSLGSAMDGVAWIALPLLVTVAVVVAGYIFFARAAPRVAEEL
jgi:ABC-type polysaccharide/polyol phosphate export permease